MASRAHARRLLAWTRPLRWKPWAAVRPLWERAGPLAGRPAGVTHPDQRDPR